VWRLISNWATSWPTHHSWHRSHSRCGWRCLPDRRFTRGSAWVLVSSASSVPRWFWFMCALRSTTRWCGPAPPCFPGSRHSAIYLLIAGTYTPFHACVPARTSAGMSSNRMDRPCRRFRLQGHKRERCIGARDQQVDRGVIENLENMAARSATSEW